jgi:hypothetical protein
MPFYSNDPFQTQLDQIRQKPAYAPFPEAPLFSPRPPVPFFNRGPPFGESLFSPFGPPRGARSFEAFMMGGPMTPDMQQIWAPNPGRLYRPPRIGAGRYYVPNRFTQWNPGL